MVGALPKGTPLSPEVWEKRHRWIVGLLWLQCVPLVIGSVLVRAGLAHSVAELVPVPALAFLASRSWVARSMRSCIAAVGLMVAAATMVHLSGGRTELHFYFFVLLGVIALYQDWRPFLTSIAFVALHHAIVGVIAPQSVYDTPEAIGSPIAWTGVHVLFVAAMSAVSVTSWRFVEDTNRAAAEAIAARGRRFQAMIEHSTDAVLLSDGAGTLLYSSPAWNRMLGYPPATVVSGWEMLHPDDLAVSTAMFENVMTGGRSEAVEIRLRHRDGSYRWIEVAATNMLDESAVGAIVSNCRDVTERRQLEDELAHQAFHDSLTGLANRALLLDRLELALDRARSRPGLRLALLYLDLDDFKTVNDGLGHEAGDTILVATAERIREVLRAGDTAARLGGDEFAVLLEQLDTDPEAAYEIGGRVLEAVCTPFEVDGTLIAVHASLGIVVSDGQEDAASLLRNADLAMYRAKGDGKGRFEIYEAGMHAAVVERMARKADLRRAVAAQEFEPHYQPIMDLESGTVAGVEALARWRHPERGIVYPGDFVPLAEETGLIVDIGRHILRRACADAASWAEELGIDAPRSIAVNLSARQIQDPAIVDDVAAALREAPLDPSRLTLEITESALLADTDATARTLAALKALGVRLALDDFGTGFSSLSHLDRFPVDIVKIDKSFVDSLADTNGTPSPLVGAILRLGAALGVDVTAEGIEYAGQLVTLRSLGCRSGQGFYFAKPMPAAALRRLLEVGVGTTTGS